LLHCKQVEIEGGEILKTTAETGLIFVLVGPGGAGKNALMRQILQDTEHLKQLATATTRPKRHNEQDGREHLFVTQDVFRRMIAENELLEYQEVTPGKFYGIPRASVENAWANGTDLIADIEVMGARILREAYAGRAVLVFITVPGATLEDKLDVLRQRMSNADRNEAKQLIEDRIARARVLEMPFAQEADVVIENGDINKAIDDLKGVIRTYRAKRQSNLHEVQPE
jgi:guanylate kinase